MHVSEREDAAKVAVGRAELFEPAVLLDGMMRKKALEQRATAYQGSAKHGECPAWYGPSMEKDWLEAIHAPVKLQLPPNYQHTKIRLKDSRVVRMDGCGSFTYILEVQASK